MNKLTNLKPLILESKDGEWGKEEPFGDSVEMMVIRGTDFEEVKIGSLNDVPHRFIPNIIAQRKKIRPYDIIIETAGGAKNRSTGRTLLIKPSILSRSNCPVTCASFSRFIRINPHMACSSYIYWVMQYLHKFEFMSQYNTQHTGLSRFQFTIFSESEKFPLPSFSTQRKIAVVLSTYDDLIENNSRRIKCLEEIMQAIYREWFVNFRFPGHKGVRMVESELGPVPEGWEVKTLDNIMDFQGGAQPPKNEWKYEPQNGFVRIIQIRDYDSDQYVSFVKDSEDLRKCSVHDLMIARYGASVGRICFGLAGAYNVALVKVLPSKEYYREYLRAFLKDDFFQKMLIGMSGRTAQAGFNKTNLKSISLVVPNDDNLLKKYDYLSKLMLENILLLKEKNQNLNYTRDLLLTKLISGEFDVSSLNIKIAEAEA
ncbi:restriction endonuclease subunit S [Methanoregula sp.]|uniref:restriction endonuclease subunit S n=1 Tax=Methanoregula sp. TaxID=2052170 RepID=UPI002B847286|nr:restriction endonuclease subunit S [Methanoregula sp.]HVP95652.1 restriction endonuclease subunit S [Methanoregula sp.]